MFVHGPTICAAAGKPGKLQFACLLGHISQRVYQTQQTGATLEQQHADCILNKQLKCEVTSLNYALLQQTTTE